MDMFIEVLVKVVEFRSSWSEDWMQKRGFDVHLNRSYGMIFESPHSNSLNVIKMFQFFTKTTEVFTFGSADMNLVPWQRSGLWVASP